MIWNNDSSEMPMRPVEGVSPLKMPFELYFHSTVVDELKWEIERLRNENVKI